jgi:CheY-like chemotaxis protein
MSRELLLLLLTREGYRVELAKSGETALQILSDYTRVRPEAVVADLQMPGLSGRLFAARVRALYGNSLRMIAISGSQARGEMLAGFDGFLRKPFTAAALNNLLAGKPIAASEALVCEAVMRSTGSLILNSKKYEILAASMDREKLLSLYTLCADDSRIRIAAMRNAAHRGDDQEYRRQAHAMKGSCGMVGATEMQAIAESIETNGLNSDTIDTLDKLLLACDRLLDLLSERNSMQEQSVDQRKRRSRA